MLLRCYQVLYGGGVRGAMLKAEGFGEALRVVASVDLHNRRRVLDGNIEQTL